MAREAECPVNPDEFTVREKQGEDRLGAVQSVLTGEGEVQSSLMNVVSIEGGGVPYIEMAPHDDVVMLYHSGPRRRATSRIRAGVRLIVSRLRLLSRPSKTSVGKG